MSTLFCGFVFLNGDRVVGDMRQGSGRHGNRVMGEMRQGNKRHGNRVMEDMRQSNKRHGNRVFKTWYMVIRGSSEIWSDN